jgi:uncharacterized protein (UPF0548 family)
VLALPRPFRPAPARLAAFLQAEATRPLTYPARGLTRDETELRRAVPTGFVVDHHRQRLGAGAAAWAAARAALARWEMFPRPWTAVEPAAAPIEEGRAVAVLVRTAGLWWINSARIVYVIDEPRRFGFAYGTLPGHAERGEERFLIEQHPDGEVFYDLLAFSRPRHWAARLGRPATRALQRRFARQSKAAMLAAVATAAMATPPGTSSPR